MVRGPALLVLGVAALRFIESTGIHIVCGFPVGVVRFSQPMEALSCAVLNGGQTTVEAAFIMQVPKDYNCDNPCTDAVRVRDALGLPEDSLGMMTAAEVDYVFNIKECSFDGIEAAAFATAGLSNHVIAGEALTDYDEKSLVSARRAREMKAGTINIGIVSSVPMTIEGKINLFIPLVEAKGVAMSEHGFSETGTTSDAMAVFSPIGEDRVSWTGTGSSIGIVASRAVSAAVGYALDVRNEHPSPISPWRVLEKMGLDRDGLRAMSGTGMGPEEYSRSLESLFSDEEVRALMDLAWSIADRADSMAQDGDDSELRLVLGTASRILGVQAPEEGSLMDCLISMISRRAGGLRWPAMLSRRW